MDNFNPKSDKIVNNLKNELERKSIEIELLTKLTREINNPSLKLENFYQIIEEFLLRDFEAGSYYVATYDNIDNKVTIETMIDAGVRVPRDTFKLKDKGFVSHIVKTKKTFVVNNVKKNLDSLPIEPIVYGVKKLPYSWLGVPVMRENEVVGIINMANYEVKDFTEHDVILLESIAEQTSLALEYYKNVNKIRESEAKYKDLVENVNDIIFIIDFKGNLLSINKIVESILGYRPEEVEGKNIVDFLPQEYKRRFSRFLKRIKKEKTNIGKVAVLSKSGDEILFEFNISLIETRGKLTGIRGVLRNIMEQELYIKEIEDLKKFNEDIVRFSPIGIFTVDNMGIITFENRKFMNIIGRQKSVIGTSIYDFKLFRTIGVVDMIERAKDGRSSEKYNVYYKSPVSEKDMYITIMVTPIFNNKKEVDKVLCLIEDTTKNARLEKQLIRSERLASIGTFASGIAHEINNPAYAILGLAEAIIEENSINAIKDYAGKIKDHVLEISEVVKQLSRYTIASTTPGVSLLDINEVLEDAMKMVKKLKKDIQINYITDFDDNVFLNANKLDIQQIFFNLISNSADFIDNEGTIKITTRSDMENIDIKISDTGIGILPENIDKIFDPFFTTKEPGSGIGLGLNVVYRLVSKYKGTIDVQSKPGEGTEFLLSFPVEDF